MTQITPSTALKLLEALRDLLRTRDVEATATLRADQVEADRIAYSKAEARQYADAAVNAMVAAAESEGRARAAIALAEQEMETDR